jgi:putative transposase
MPRYARPHVVGGLFHVISRFRDGEFFMDLEGARTAYLRFLGGAAQKSSTRVFAYCLMSSHVHLVLQLGADPLGRFTKSVHSGFAQWVNERRGGLGPVFADRPKSVLVHAETHGLALVRYVHNNPVRAGLVERAAESDWSSHRAYLGLDPAPPWLSMTALLGTDGNEWQQVRRELAAFVDEGRAEPRRAELSGEVTREVRRSVRRAMGAGVELCYPVIGPDDFVREALLAQVRRQRSSRSASVQLDARQVVGCVFDATGVDPALATARTRKVEIARARALAAWVWVACLGRPQADVAAAIGTGSSAASQMLSKLRERGLTREEHGLIRTVLDGLGSAGTAARHEAGEEGEAIPHVVVVRRDRNR